MIVDDSKASHLLIKALLKKGGYADYLSAFSANEAFQYLGMEGSGDPQNVDLILMDIVMPGMSGIEACTRIKAQDRLKDIPIIMVTGSVDSHNLKLAFESGAVDYIRKPINKAELLARVESVLRLKQEMDRRMEVTRQLEEANKKLKLLSSLDGLTGIANRRHFDEIIEKEWRRAMRGQTPISFIMVDIDHFKKFNDGYGHQAGDDCLKKVAIALANEMKRPGDFLARYGGEEFACILVDTGSKAARIIAEKVRSKIEGMKVPHDFSDAMDVVTISMGLSTVVPKPGMTFEKLIEAADKALYNAKHEGRNRVKVLDQGLGVKH